MATNFEDIKTAYKLFMENKQTNSQADMQTEVKVEYPTTVLLEKIIVTEN